MKPIPGVMVTATSTVSTIAGKEVKIDDRTVFYLSEQRDIEFMMDMAWSRYEKKQRFDHWANFVIGLVVGMVLLSFFAR